MLVIKTFLVNLLCSVVSCDPDYGLPEIIDAERLRRDPLSRDSLSDPIVLTNSGSVEGYFMKAANGRQIRAFEGIPYAEPPTNEFRFRAAAKKKPWKSLLSTKAIGPFCLQTHATKLFRVVGQEDCLYLNIYTPDPEILDTKSNGCDIPLNRNSTEFQKNVTKLLPVIIWIHGGAFIFGSGSEYGPAYILTEDVILVTINYRLGVLGFLSSGDLESTGNWGLKDQALAISWISENIENFGGDPNKVTLMGQSAGAVSVHLHMLSKYPSRNSFQSAISLSGNAFVHWAVQKPMEARKWATKTAQQLGCPFYESQEMMSCLRQLNPVTLVANQINLFEWFPFPVVIFAPVLESPDAPDPFITESPDVLYDRGDVAKIPFITSITAQEGHTALLFTETLLRTGMIKSNWWELAPLVLNYKGKVNSTRDLSQKISNFYFGEGGPASSTLARLSDIASDRYFTFGFHKGLQRHSRLAPTFGYFFSFKGNYGLGSMLGLSPSEWGVGHVEDVFYMYNSSSLYPGFKEGDPEREMSRIVVNLLSNFATERVPRYTNPEDGSKLNIWSQVGNLSQITVLQLDKDIKMIAEPFPKRIRFWESLNLEDTKPFF